MKRDGTSARVRANRANARASTGPKTAAGKRRAAQNAGVHGLRAASGVFQGDARVTQLAALIAGPGAGPTTRALAADVAEAHLSALLARRLSAAAWQIFQDDHPMDRSLVDAVDDPVMAEVLDPEARAWIRGDDAVDALESRLVARVEAYARKLRARDAQELTRRIQVLNRYEGRALARLRAASAAFTRFLPDRPDGAYA